ncbi:MAG: hypothetical protein M3Q23_10050 [Actinomycetota bacterium]|nr:hypothetical protein [Actinomycetota bacterium]
MPKTDGAMFVPRFRPWTRAAVLASLLAVLAQACNPTSGTTRSTSPTPAPPVTSSPTPVDQDVLAGRLAQETLDPDTGADAVARILTLSGIPVVSARDGSLLNQPASPTFIDAYVYDVQLPMLADALQSNRTWFLEDLWDVPTYLLPLVAQPLLDQDRFAQAIQRWVQNALADPTAPGAFPALVFRQLSEAHSPPQNVFFHLDPDSFRLDPIQFAILAAQVMSRVGHIQSTASPSPGTCAVVVAAPTPVAGIGAGLRLASVAGHQAAVIRNVLRAHGLLEAGGDLVADLLLLAGIHFDATASAGQRIHAPKAPDDASRRYDYTATLRFDSSMAGQTIACGGLSGIELPKAGPVRGWTIEWTVVQDDHLVAPAGREQAEKLAGGGVHGELGSSGETTGPDGISTLRMLVSLDAGCPGSPNCAAGPPVTGTVNAFALIDMKRTSGPFTLETLLTDFPRVAAPPLGLALRWRDAALGEIGLPVAFRAMTVSHHLPVG